MIHANEYACSVYMIVPMRDGHVHHLYTDAVTENLNLQILWLLKDSQLNVYYYSILFILFAVSLWA